VGWALVYPCARDNSTYRESAVGSLNNWTQRSNPDNDITELHNQNAKPSHPWNSKATVPTNTLGIGAQNAGGNIPQKYRLQETSPPPPPFPKRFSHANHHHCFHHCHSRIFSHTQTYAPPHPTPPAKVKTINQPIDPRFFLSDDALPSPIILIISNRRCHCSPLLPLFLALFRLLLGHNEDYDFRETVQSPGTKHYQ